MKSQILELKKKDGLYVISDGIFDLANLNITSNQQVDYFLEGIHFQLIRANMWGSWKAMSHTGLLEFELKFGFWRSAGIVAFANGKRYALKYRNAPWLVIQVNDDRSKALLSCELSQTAPPEDRIKLYIMQTETSSNEIVYLMVLAYSMMLLQLNADMETAAFMNITLYS